jgi:hypothetical protein
MILYSKDWTLIAHPLPSTPSHYTCHSGASEALVYDSLPRTSDRRSPADRAPQLTYLAGTAIAGGIAALVARISWMAVPRGDRGRHRGSPRSPDAAETISVAPARRGQTASRRKARGLLQVRPADSNGISPPAGTQEPSVALGYLRRPGDNSRFYGQSLLKRPSFPYPCRPVERRETCWR